MIKLEDYTLKQVSDYIIDDIVKNKGISKALARKLFINALTYNVVFNAIDEHIDFMIEDDE